MATSDVANCVAKAEDASGRSELISKMFEDPKLKEKIAELTKAGDEMGTGKKARRRNSESMILDLGLGHAAI